MPDLPADIRDRPIIWTPSDGIAGYMDVVRAERLRLINGAQPMPADAWDALAALTPDITPLP